MCLFFRVHHPSFFVLPPIIILIHSYIIGKRWCFFRFLGSSASYPFPGALILIIFRRTLNILSRFFRTYRRFIRPAFLRFIQHPPDTSASLQSYTSLLPEFRFRYTLPPEALSFCFSSTERATLIPRLTDTGLCRNRPLPLPPPVPRLPVPPCPAVPPPPHRTRRKRWTRTHADGRPWSVFTL